MYNYYELILVTIKEVFLYVFTYYYLLNYIFIEVHCRSSAVYGLPKENLPNVSTRVNTAAELPRLAALKLPVQASYSQSLTAGLRETPLETGTKH